jgi:hypothetical protein
LGCTIQFVPGSSHAGSAGACCLHGVGIQRFFWKFISLQTELPWIHGEKTYEAGDYHYRRDGFEDYTVKDVRTENTVKVFSHGLSVGGYWWDLFPTTTENTVERYIVAGLPRALSVVACEQEG